MEEDLKLQMKNEFTSEFPGFVMLDFGIIITSSEWLFILKLLLWTVTVYLIFNVSLKENVFMKIN